MEGRHTTIYCGIQERELTVLLLLNREPDVGVLAVEVAENGQSAVFAIDRRKNFIDILNCIFLIDN